MSAYLSILNIRHYCLLLLPKYVAGLKMKEVSANVVEVGKNSESSDRMNTLLIYIAACGTYHSSIVYRCHLRKYPITIQTKAFRE